MRKLVLALAVSMDGFIEGPNGEYDWCFSDQDYGMADFFKRIDSLFMGRKTYEQTLIMGNNPMPGFPRLKEYVFSSKLKAVKPGTILIRGDIQLEVSKVKSESGKDIWLFGGASLTSTLLNLKLIDEIRLSVHPVLLGDGKPLFSDIKERVNLSLLNSKQYSTGLVSLSYAIVN